MDIFWLILTLLALSAWLGWLAHVVREDGLGHREPPRSHPDDTPLTRVRSL